MELENESQARELRSSSLDNGELIKISEQSSYRTKEECKEISLADKPGYARVKRRLLTERKGDYKAGDEVPRDWAR